MSHSGFLFVDKHVPMATLSIIRPSLEPKPTGLSDLKLPELWTK